MVIKKNTYSNKKSISALVVLTATDDKSKSREGLQSLANITNNLDEIILVMNGESKDFFFKYFSVIKHFPLEKLTLILSRELLNLGPALNLGLEIAKTDWIMRVDPDDISVEYRVTLFKSMKNLFSFDVYSTSKFIRETKKNLNLKNYPSFNGDYADFLWLRNPIPHSTVFFRRSTIMQLGGYRDIPFMEDYDLWIRASSINVNFFSINVPTVIFNGDGVKKRRKNLKVLKSEILILKSKKKFLNLNFCQLLFSAIIRFFYYLIPIR